MSEPGFAMNGGWQEPLYSDPFEDDPLEGEFKFEDEGDDWGEEDEEVLEDCP